MAIINDILDFSQIGSNSLRLVSIKKNLIDTVKEAISLMEIQAKKKNLSIHLDLLTPNPNIQVSTDHNRLLQIITNLLSNALKFTFKGEIRVIIQSLNKNHQLKANSKNLSEQQL